MKRQKSITDATERFEAARQELVDATLKDIIVYGNDLTNCEFLQDVINALVTQLEERGVELEDLVIEGLSTFICAYYKVTHPVVVNNVSN